MDQSRAQMCRQRAHTMYSSPYLIRRSPLHIRPILTKAVYPRETYFIWASYCLWGYSAHLFGQTIGHLLRFFDLFRPGLVSCPLRLGPLLKIADDRYPLLLLHTLFLFVLSDLCLLLVEIPGQGDHVLEVSTAKIVLQAQGRCVMRNLATCAPLHM